MKTVGIFYGSSTGNTGDAAKAIQNKIGDAKIFDVSDVKAEDLNDFSNIILGTSTWGAGDLQDDFEDFLDGVDSIDLSGKKVALFGMGDQESHGDTFIDGLAEVYKKVTEKGATVIGKTSSEGYEHEDSESEIDGQFIGLALD
ncbi:MAG: flavodoxin, partial [Flavobacteriales bacterium]|nr:flavodoxin [Flavobacteriales bacterium]